MSVAFARLEEEKLQRLPGRYDPLNRTHASVAELLNVSGSRAVSADDYGRRVRDWATAVAIKEAPDLDRHLQVNIPAPPAEAYHNVVQDKAKKDRKPTVVDDGKAPKPAAKDAKGVKGAGPVIVAAFAKIKATIGRPLSASLSDMFEDYYYYLDEPRIFTFRAASGCKPEP